MNLSFKKFGSGHPLIILHGLYGSGDNWLSIGKDFAGFCEVYLPDQRNHGNSPHHDEHNYQVLMADLKDFLDQNGILKAMILGHSMGGKAAMWFATEYPGRVSKLIVADISPDSYIDDDNIGGHWKTHESIIDALMKIDLSKAESLSAVDSELESSLPDSRLRKFLLKSLGKDEEKGYFWKLNLQALKNNLKELSDGLDFENISGKEFKTYPVLFIRGQNSNYVRQKDIDLIRQIFPLAQIVSLKNAGHWLHAEQAEKFTEIVKRFIIS